MQFNIQGKSDSLQEKNIGESIDHIRFLLFYGV